jgi:hypothetical protein
MILKEKNIRLDMTINISQVFPKALALFLLSILLGCVGTIGAVEITDIQGGMQITGSEGEACIPDIITVFSLTNYNTENQVIVEISPAEFEPRSKNMPPTIGGAIAKVDVEEGDYGNYWSMAANTTDWQTGMYLVQASFVGKDHVESKLITLEPCEITLDLNRED